MSNNNEHCRNSQAEIDRDVEESRPCEHCGQDFDDCDCCEECDLPKDECTCEDKS
jgi:hypothetical protein